MNKPSLNYVQAWALGYWIDMDRRQQLEDKVVELKMQTYNLFPERWATLYREEMLGDLRSAGDQGEAFGHGVKEIPVTNLDDIDAWYDSISQSRGISGEQVYQHQEAPVDMSRLLGHAEGEGRRV